MDSFKKIMLSLHLNSRKNGRVNERAGLEIRYTTCWYRGFESLFFRISFIRRIYKTVLLRFAFIANSKTVF